MIKRNQVDTTTIGCLLALVLLIAVLNPAAAEPRIAQVTLLDSGEVKHGIRVKVKGDEFGFKADASPVLVDYVHTAFENGTENRVNSGLNDMSGIPLGRNGDPNALWATSTDGFLFTTQGPHRHSNSEASYFFEGESEWVGRPVAYGGANGWNTPTDNPQLYVSWWYKNKFHSTWYWRFSPNKQKGEFEIGEELRIDGLSEEYSRGVYVGVDRDGLHNAVLYNHRNANLLVNAVIRGIRSGATTIFPEKSRGGSGFGNEIVGSKLARVWDDPSGSNGIRSSVALHDAYAASAKMYYRLDLRPDEWVHLEYELDTDKGLLRIRENGKVIGEKYFSPDAAFQGKYSPTLTLLGTNGKQLKLQESWISEIYVDSALQRVVVGNAKSFSELTHYEIQRPVKWNDTDIEFIVNLGSLHLDQGLYVYVFDSMGVANSEGYPLCIADSCPIPPSRIQLSVD